MPVEQSETSVIERQVRIEASPETVFQFFTDPEKMVRWMCVAAMFDPRPGGVFRASVPTESVAVKGNYVDRAMARVGTTTWRDSRSLPRAVSPGRMPWAEALREDG